MNEPGADGDRSPVRPSTVKLPEEPPPGVRTIFDFFLQRFPRVPRAIWVERFATGKVWSSEDPIDAVTSYRPLLEVHYRREVKEEPPVREDYRVVWSDNHLMVVDKPPNLPVTPGGRWVRGCLLHLLLGATGNENIAPLHRLDRSTSGLVLLSTDPSTRSHYGRLFQPEPAVEKVYTAVCEAVRAPQSRRLIIENHIARSQEEYWRQVVIPDLHANARCEAEFVEEDSGLLLLKVRPSTGRKHQIRVQLAHAGLPILGDPLYGTARSNNPGDLVNRMWLDAHQLSVRGFPRPQDVDVLTAAWTSSRPPFEFFRQALRRRVG